jgi:hypothetical protein
LAGRRLDGSQEASKRERNRARERESEVKRRERHRERTKQWKERGKERGWMYLVRRRDNMTVDESNSRRENQESRRLHRRGDSGSRFVRVSVLVLELQVVGQGNRDGE